VGTIVVGEQGLDDSQQRLDLTDALFPVSAGTGSAGGWVRSWWIRVVSCKKDEMRSEKAGLGEGQLMAELVP
jgi:hypothetical protein